MNKEELMDRILKVFSKYVDEKLDLYTGNRYLLSVIEMIIHEYGAGLWKPDELKDFAAKLREKLIEGPGNVNPFIMEILGIIEEGVNEENIREALDIAKRLWKEDRFDKLEV